jgi:hypothetical protein
MLLAIGILFSTIAHTLAVLTTISDFAMMRCVALPKRASVVIHP